MYERGKTENNPDAKGLVFLINNCISDVKTYSKRAIKININLQGKDSVTVINACAPTSSTGDEKVDRFYDGIERAMAESDPKSKIITGDFSAKIGTKTKNTSKAWEHFGIGKRNDRGLCN